MSSAFHEFFALLDIFEIQIYKWLNHLQFECTEWSKLDFKTSSITHISNLSFLSLLMSTINHMYTVSFQSFSKASKVSDSWFCENIHFHTSWSKRSWILIIHSTYFHQKMLFYFLKIQNLDVWQNKKVTYVHEKSMHVPYFVSSNKK